MPTPISPCSTTSNRAKPENSGKPHTGLFRSSHSALLLLLLLAVLTGSPGCSSGSAEKKNRGFFTSGSREADQRASQRMAKAEQLAGSGEGAGERSVKEATSEGGATKPAQAMEKLALYDRLGREAGISRIVDDFMPRLLQDPRVNWERKEITRGGFSFRRNQPVSWNPTPQNVARVKKHLAQFLSLATGGPARYDGKEMKAAHAGLHISNPEFDAAIGDIKASLDRLQIPNQEQKELLAIFESTRPQIVEER